MTRLFLAAAVCIAIANPVSAQSNRLNPTADYALINGQIHTMDADGTVATAIGIEGDEIVYVGDASGLDRVIGIGTEVIDLDGKMVLPGFVEGHMHPVAGGLIASGVDLQTDDKEELFRRIRKEVEENSDDEVIIGWGLRLNVWTDGNPTAAMLDEIESDRPVYFWAIDGHNAWVNSKALEVAGVDKETPDTVPGYSFFERDEEGNPSGWVVELPAQMQILTALIDISPEYFTRGMLNWFPRFSAAGITTVHDHGIQGLGQIEGFEILTDLEEQGKIPVRLIGSYYWNDPATDPLVPLTEMRERFNNELVKAEYLKINMDGGDPAWNALYLDGYLDRPDVVAEPIIPVDILNDVVQRADAQGINVTCHCFGDLAVRYLLDAVESAIAVNPPRDRRHKITHGMSVHPDDRHRFAELGVTYDSTGAWMSYAPDYQTITDVRIGRERSQQSIPMRAIAEAGGNVSLGSDWPASGYISEYRPLFGIETAVTRQLNFRRDVPPLGGDEARLPLDLALRAATINAAYGMDMDDEVGSIEVGKKADLVVLSENLYEIDPRKISEVQVLYTLMDGKLTYDHEKQPENGQ